MSSKQNRRGERRGSARGKGHGGSSPPRGASPGAGGARPPAPQPAHARAPKPRPNRTRQFIAAGVVAAVLVAVVAFVLLSQPRQQDAGTLAPERHALGKPQAPVTITEWSDFQ